MLWLAVLGAILVWLDNCLLVTSLQRGAGQGKTRNAYQISPKPCWVDGVEGTCMFVWECIKSEGYHVGMCVDTFMFGSCCAYNSTVNTVQHGLVGGGGGGGGQGGYNGGNKVSVLYTQHPASQPKPGGQRPGATTSRPNKYTSSSRRPQQPSSYQQQSTPSQLHSQNNRPSTPPPRHSLRPMSTDHLQQHASNAIIALDASQQQTSSQQQGGSSSGTLGVGVKPYYGKPQMQPNSRPGGWRPDGGIKTGSVIGGWHSTTESGSVSSTNAPQNLTITKPGVLWQVTTEPGFVTRVKNKPVTSHNGQKVRPTKKPVLPVTTAKVTTKYYTKSTTSTTSTTTTSKTTTRTSTSTQAPPPMPSRRPNPLLSSLMLLTSTLSDNKISASSSATSSPINSIASTEMAVSATNTEAIPCGQPSLTAHPHSRIVGGKNAAFGRWPWQVSVRRTSFFGFSSTHRCGGAILNENWIATAGHCVDDLLTSQIRIRVGDYDFSSVQEDLPHVERAVARKVVHPKYNFFTYEYDLALVQLDQPLMFAPHISPICLPASDDLLIGENGTVTGWGRLSEGGTLPSVLQEVLVPILSNDKCKSMFLRAGRHEFIPDIFLCAGHEVGGQDSCQGDSGGPLQVRGRDGRYFLAGIISWGIGCAEANLPGVCTRISKFVPWVLNNVT